MIYVRDGLTFSNENSTLGDAILRWFSSRRAARRSAGPRERGASERSKTPARRG